MEELLIQPIRNIHIKFELLKNGAIVDVLQGVAYQGSIQGNAQSAVRKTANIGLILNDYNDYLPSELSKIWLNSEVIISVGLAADDEDITWEPQGQFVFLNFDLNRSQKGITMNCNVGDRMVLLDGSVQGTLDLQTVLLPQGTTISQAMKQTLKQIGHINENNIAIEEMNEPIPYEISAPPGESIASLFKKLLDLYLGREMYWDGNVFVAGPIKDGADDAYTWDFTADQHGLTISHNNGLDFTNVKNKIAVFGKVSQNGVQLKTTYHNKYLRNHLNREIHATTDEIIIPFIHDQKLGDIVHINNVQAVREYSGDCKWDFPKKQNENNLQFPEFPNQFDGLIDWRNKRYERKFLSQPRSYIYTDRYTRKQFFVANNNQHPDWSGINTGPEAKIRLDFYPDLSYPFVATSLTTPETILRLEPIHTLRCIGEPATRWFYVKRVSPDPVQNEQAVAVEGEGYKHYKLSKSIFDTVNAEVYVNGKRVKDVVRTNRENKGYLIFPTALQKTDVVTVNYLARNPGQLFVNEDIEVLYTYEMSKAQWIELNFNVVPEFRSELIGESVLEFSNQDIFNKTQADLRAEYELFKHSHLAEQIKCECVPIYTLKENRKIKIYDPKIGIGMDYLIDNISTPLELNSPMTFSAHKILVPFKVAPIERPLIEAAFKPCLPTEVLYPSSTTQCYKYDIASKTFKVENRIAGKETIALTTVERAQISDLAKTLTWQYPSEQNAFWDRMRLMLYNLLFDTEDDKTTFKQHILQSAAQLKQIVNTLPKMLFGNDGVEMVKEYCHYVGTKSGKITLKYDLGGGNSLEQIQAWIPNEAPDTLKKIADIPSGVNKCEYVYDNWPKKKPPLPPRGYKDEPAATVDFKRGADKVEFDYKYYDYEPTIKTKVISHFCASAKFSSEKLPLGKIDNNIITTKETVWLGAIPSANFRMSFALSQGNTRDKAEIFYEDKLIATTTTFTERATKVDLTFPWQPKEGKYSVEVVITSKGV